MEYFVDYYRQKWYNYYCVGYLPFGRKCKAMDFTSFVLSVFASVIANCLSELYQMLKSSKDKTKN
ncbi:MAG: hypothetical protein IJP18_05280 [Oscillospiraceae bacterium]|nr:hypothetical protein [Oscillospiraceae bacterium]